MLPQLSFTSGTVGATNDATQAMVEPALFGMVKSSLSMVISLVTGSKDLPQASVAVHVSVIVPLHAGEVENVDEFEVPLIKHPPLNPLLNGSVELEGKLVIHEIVKGPGAVIVGNVAGLTVIV